MSNPRNAPGKGRGRSGPRYMAGGSSRGGHRGIPAHDRAPTPQTEAAAAGIPCPNAPVCDNGDCNFDHPSIPITGLASPVPSNHIGNNRTEKTSFFATWTPTKPQHNELTCEDVNCEEEHPLIDIVDFGELPSNQCKNTEGKRALLQRRRNGDLHATSLKLCPKPDGCRFGVGCKNAHPQAVCQGDHCENVECSRKDHPMLKIDGIDGIDGNIIERPCNLYFNTAGKLNFLSTPDACPPLKMCNFSRCRDQLNCHFLHSIIQFTKCRKVPQGHIMVHGEPMSVDMFDRTEGLKKGSNMGYWSMCSREETCPMRLQCRFLHFEIRSGKLDTCHDCGEAKPWKQGRNCWGTASHFVCDGCFSRHVRGHSVEETCWAEGCGCVITDSYQVYQASPQGNQ